LIPGWAIDAVCVATNGAHASYTHGYYPRDNAFYTAWDDIASDRDRFLEWMDERACAAGGARVTGDWTSTEMMTIAASRALSNDDVCFVGIGAPSAACNLARLTRCPDITLIYESGTLGTAPEVLPLSIGDSELAGISLTTVSVPEMFRYWLQGGHISIGFLGGAQLDRYGNINSTVIGDYAVPRSGCRAGAGRQRSPCTASGCS
jgi:acyl CoA:acetate/3-ketoacid CoA transferase